MLHTYAKKKNLKMDSYFRLIFAGQARTALA
jgi:hypothetical protein